MSIQSSAYSYGTHGVQLINGTRRAFEQEGMYLNGSCEKSIFVIQNSAHQDLSKIQSIVDGIWVTLSMNGCVWRFEVVNRATGKPQDYCLKLVPCEFQIQCTKVGSLSQVPDSLSLGSYS